MMGWLADQFGFSADTQAKLIASIAVIGILAISRWLVLRAVQRRGMGVRPLASAVSRGRPHRDRVDQGRCRRYPPVPLLTHGGRQLGAGRAIHRAIGARAERAAVQGPCLVLDWEEYLDP